MKFHTGPNEETDLTDDQIHQQCKMYIAAVRIADDFGCHAIGIQYQQGLKDLLPASRPGRRNAEQRRSPAGARAATAAGCLYEGEPLPHFNEVDECAGLDGADDLPRPQGDGPAGRKHAARSALGRCGPLGHGRRLRLGLPDQRHRRRRPISSAAGPAPAASASRRCISASAAARSRASAKPGEIVWSRIYHRRRRAEDGPGPRRRRRACRRKKRSAAGTRPRRNGRSCTPSPTASPATR